MLCYIPGMSGNLITIRISRDIHDDVIKRIMKRFTMNLPGGLVHEPSKTTLFDSVISAGAAAIEESDTDQPITVTPGNWYFYAGSPFYVTKVGDLATGILVEMDEESPREFLEMSLPLSALSTIQISPRRLDY